MPPPESPVPAAPAPAGRPPRLFWAHAGCLMDTSSGAAMAVREMLLQLVKAGYAVQVLGATLFDHERGLAGLGKRAAAVRVRRGQVVPVSDGPLTHQVYVTARTQREAMTAAEERHWFYRFREVLDTFRPDVLFYFGGQPLEMLMAAEARARGIPVVFYLANGTYQLARWCRDVDLILTNSQANADLYHTRLGVNARPLGPFIDPAAVLAPQRDPKRLLFVNPVPEKGAVVVVRLAQLMAQRRPDIVFEVVESRGTWAQALQMGSAARHPSAQSLTNVVVTPHTTDMRSVYARARLLLAPSLWWESMGRVLVEALMNGIPAVITDRGGMPEMVRDAGFVLPLEPACFDPPYSRCPSDASLQPLLERIEHLYDDEAAYGRLAAAAARVGETWHRDASTRRLLDALAPWVQRRAGDADLGALLRQQHRHGLDDRAGLSPTPADEAA